MARSPDGGASDVIGTVMMLAATLTLFAVVTVQVLGGAQTSEQAPNVEISVAARAGARYVEVTHMGGEPLHLEQLRAIVLVNGTTWYDDLASADERLWQTGDIVAIGPFDTDLAEGSRVELSLTSLQHEATVSHGSTDIGSTASATTLNGFSITLTLQSGATAVTSPGTLYVQVVPSHDGGRKAVSAITVDLSSFKGPTHFELKDAGTEGDTVAGDGIYSAHVLVPSGLVTGRYTVTATAVDIHGHVAAGSATVVVEAADSSSQYYQTTLFHKVGHMVRWGNTGSGNSGDSITAILMFETNATITLGSATYKVDGAAFLYDAPRGASGSTHSQPREHGLVKYGSCPKKNLAGMDENYELHGWHGQNKTIDHWKQGRDPLRYYWLVKMSGGGQDNFVAFIYSSEQEDWFVLRAHEKENVVQDNGWPTSWTNCA